MTRLEHIARLPVLIAGREFYVNTVEVSTYSCMNVVCTKQHSEFTGTNVRILDVTNLATVLYLLRSSHRPPGDLGASNFSST
jgi:phosphoserine aminotransferase